MGMTTIRRLPTALRARPPSPMQQRGTHSTSRLAPCGSRGLDRASTSARTHPHGSFACSHHHLRGRKRGLLVINRVASVLPGECTYVSTWTWRGLRPLPARSVPASRARCAANGGGSGSPDCCRRHLDAGLGVGLKPGARLYERLGGTLLCEQPFDLGGSQQTESTASVAKGA